MTLSDERFAMWHDPSTIRKANIYFDGYLTESEMSERQYYGRFWEITETPDYVYLHILLDGDTAVRVSFFKKDKTLNESIIDKISSLPQSLREKVVINNLKYETLDAFEILADYENKVNELLYKL